MFLLLLTAILSEPNMIQRIGNWVEKKMGIEKFWVSGITLLAPFLSLFFGDTPPSFPEWRTFRMTPKWKSVSKVQWFVLLFELHFINIRSYLTNRSTDEVDLKLLELYDDISWSWFLLIFQVLVSKKKVCKSAWIFVKSWKANEYPSGISPM